MANKKDEEIDEFDDVTNEETNFNQEQSSYTTADEAGIEQLEPVSKAPLVPDSGMDDDGFDEVDIDQFETQINSIKVDDIDDFSEKMDYEKFIVLSKRDVLSFCAAVEPMAKTSVDDYGKSVYIKALDNGVVELNYFNSPNRLTMTAVNKSGKTVKDFAILVTTLKKLVSNAYASLVFVEEEDQINIALCDSLLYIETKPLDPKEYEFVKEETTDFMDKEVATYTFKKVGAMLNSSDRASEKVIVIKNNFANFNTGFFAAKSKSPFTNSEDFIIYKMVSDVITILATISKVDLRFSLKEDKLILSCDGAIYCELPVATGEKVSEFYSPLAESSLKFDAPIVIVNDSLLRLIQVTRSLDYLSDIVTLVFTKEQMQLLITNTNQTKTSEYKFEIIEGEPERMGNMKLSCQVLISFFGITGSNIKYAFTEEGLGIKNELGTFLLRRSQ